MDARDWDQRYAAAYLVWSVEPNEWVEQIVAGLPPGRALDLGAGEGRNALWLVERGWTVVAVDFSAVAVERMAELAGTRLGDDDSGRLVTLVGDVTDPSLALPGGFDLVVLSYLQLAEPCWTQVLRRSVRALTRGGRVVVVGHAAANLTGGVGGPSDPAVLHDPDQVVAAASGGPVRVERAEVCRRQTDAGLALDTVVVLVRT